MILFFTCSTKSKLSKKRSEMLLQQFGGKLWQTEHHKSAYFCPKLVKIVQIGYFVVVFLTFEPKMLSTSNFHKKIWLNIMTSI